MPASVHLAHPSFTSFSAKANAVEVGRGGEGVMVLLVMDVKGLKWDVIRTAKLYTLTSRWSGQRRAGMWLR